jgi:hypothetical protein
MYNTCFSCQILTKIELSRQIFENAQKSKFLKIHSLGVDIFHAERQTDGHEEVNSRLSPFFERA